MKEKRFGKFLRIRYGYSFLLIIWYWLSILTGLATPLLAQSRLQGFVVDQVTKQPLAYVNIGIPGEPIGTLSNADGSFSIQVPAQYQADSLLVSHLGYAPQFIALAVIPSTITISLIPAPIQLPSVQVLAQKKAKLVALGNKLADNSFIVTDTLQAGSAMALLIENKFPQFHAKLKTPFFVQKAAIQIHSNTFAEFKLRVRLLAYDSLTGLPGRDLLQQSVLITSRRQQGGWLEADLSAFGIRIDEPQFYLVVEWILDESDRRLLANQYQQFALTHPQQVRTDTSIVAGRIVPYTRWKGYQEGTAFSTSTLPYSLKYYQCFYRHNSQGAWILSPHILTARLFVTSS